MLEHLKDGVILYHGSYCEVKSPDLQKCSRFKVAHRQMGSLANVTEQYRYFDIIAGKVANDATNSTIVNYMARAYGPVGSAKADSICIGLLLPDRLKNQCSFRTVKALANLDFNGSEKSWM